MSPTAQASELLEATRALVDGSLLPAWPQHDADLAALAVSRDRLRQRFTLAVVGEFSSGKSYLLNAMLGKVRRDGDRVSGLLAVDINPSTATITELEYAPDESARARYASGRSERIPLDQLSRFVAVGNNAPGALHDATADDDAAPTHVSVRIASPFLRRGFVIADTPGLASLNPAHRRATLGYLPRTDAVLYLIDTQQPFTDGDAAFLGLIGEHVRTVFIVQTKIDLWRMQESNGQAAWQNARDRVAARAARYAPNAEVFALSARDYALGQIDNDPALLARSGFPAFLNALDKSLEERVQQARIVRATEVAGEILARAHERAERRHVLLATPVSDLRVQRERAASRLAERDRELEQERSDVVRVGEERQTRLRSRGATLASDLTRAMGTVLDIADIERVRDRGKMHVLVDATAAHVFGAFATEVAAGLADELERIARSRPGLRVSELVAVQLGGEPGTGAWSRDVSTGIRSTIVLGAIGGPTVAFVHAVGSAFAAHGHGRYMKRELGNDLRERFFPALERDVHAFVNDLSERIGGVYRDIAARIEAERGSVSAELLAPIEQVLSLCEDAAACRRETKRIATVIGQIDALQTRARALAAAPVLASTPAVEPVAGDAPVLPFDADVYQSGLRPERWRVVILGALRRGKSSLINAIAGTRLLQDEGTSEAIFPIHVRYGPEPRAFALVREGEWHAIPLEAGTTQAAQTPVLIEVPWNLPKELVLVHAPAFDSGNPHAEEIALAAAHAASEVVALFSRQLSDAELALYTRVAAGGKPLQFAHTIADNESAAERRTVVELAGRYLTERGIAYKRIFTVSAHDFDEAVLARRAPSGWNEFGALRETLAAHAEEHMQRLAQRETPQGVSLPTLVPGDDDALRSPFRRAFDRLFGRSSRERHV